MITRILIVDDTALIRQRLRDLLQQHPGWMVCGEAVDGQDAVRKAKQLLPDLVVLDFLMPGMNGLQAAREIAKLVPNVPILMFSMHLSRQLVEEARNAGCRGAVAKSDVNHVIQGLEALLRTKPSLVLAGVLAGKRRRPSPLKQRIAEFIAKRNFAAQPA